MLKPDDGELADIRDALYSKVESLKEHLETLAAVQENLAKGEPVPPFAPGEAGIRAAKGMAADMGVRIERIEKLIEKVDTELFGGDFGD